MTSSKQKADTSVPAISDPEPKVPVGVDVVHMVAAAKDVDPIDLPPLYYEIDAEALDCLFETTPNGKSRSGEVQFTYCGYRVTVQCCSDNDPIITVSEA